MCALLLPLPPRTLLLSPLPQSQNLSAQVASRQDAIFEPLFAYKYSVCIQRKRPEVTTSLPSHVVGRTTRSILGVFTSLKQAFPTNKGGVVAKKKWTELSYLPVTLTHSTRNIETAVRARSPSPPACLHIVLHLPHSSLSLTRCELMERNLEFSTHASTFVRPLESSSTQRRETAGRCPPRHLNYQPRHVLAARLLLSLSLYLSLLTLAEGYTRKIPGMFRTLSIDFVQPPLLTPLRLCMPSWCALGENKKKV